MYGTIKIFLKDGTIDEYCYEEWDDFLIEQGILNLYKIVGDRKICISMYNLDCVQKVIRR